MAQAPAAQADGPRDPAEMRTFFEGLYGGLERAHHLSGMTVAVVRDGQTLFLRGYGYADIEHRKRVDPEKTLFRLGSVSKAFTWTAVMQLIAEGRLDVNSSIQQFVPDELEIRSPWRVQPTIRDLMTHTPGYDDLPVIGLFRRTPYAGTLHDALAEVQPIMVRKPGEMVSYSNYGAALAGYIVERISGVTFEEYTESQILRPLGMSDGATFRQPVPEELSANVATGYRWSNGELQPQGFEYVPLAPAGGGSASAAAMARFMLAHLGDGHIGDARIMPDWTARQMREPLYRATPRSGAWLHGLYELRSDSPRVYGHGGDTLWFHSLLAFFPESQTGLFISLNSDSGAAARGEVYQAFLSHYYPQPDLEIPAPLAGAQERTRAIAGWYQTTRLPRRTAARISALWGSRAMKAEGPGRLLVSGPGMPAPLHYVETEPWVYREVRGPGRLAFTAASQQPPDAAHFSNEPFSAYTRIAMYAAPPVQIAIAAICSLGILISLIAYPIAAIQRHLGNLTVDTRMRVSQLVAWATSVAFTVFLVSLLNGLQDPNQIVFGLPPALVAAQWAGRIGAILSVITAASAVILWARGFGSVIARLAHTAAVLCQVVLALWAAGWNLLG